MIKMNCNLVCANSRKSCLHFERQVDSMKKYLLGIDIGTSSCKTVLFSLDGSIVSSSSREYETIYGGIGEVEQDPALWWGALCETTQEILKKTCIDAAEICSIGIDSQSSAFIPMDRDRVLHNALIWTDRRAQKQQLWLEEHVDISRQRAINGNRYDASNVGTKALWWKQVHPDEYGATTVILNACGYIVYKLTDKYSCNISEADLSQLTDQKSGAWSDELMEAYGLDKQMFPPIYHGNDVVGGLSEKAASLTGLIPGIPITAGAMDVASTALGSQVYQSGDAVVTGGTVTGIALCSDEFISQNTAHVYHHMIKGKWLYCASIDFGGGSLRWFRDQFMDAEAAHSNTYDLMDNMAREIPSGSDRLIFMPYMVGQRCPEWDSNMTGVFFGLRPQHTKAHCIRAIMEGTAFGLNKIVRMFDADDLHIKRLMIAGGCTKSDVWMDIFSQVLAQSNLFRSEAQELAALGSAIGAGLAVGVYRSWEEAVSCCHVEKMEYGEHDRELYSKLSGMFQSLYPVLKESFRQLSTIDN